MRDPLVELYMNTVAIFCESPHTQWDQLVVNKEPEHHFTYIPIVNGLLGIIERNISSRISAHRIKCSMDL